MTYAKLEVDRTVRFWNKADTSEINIISPGCWSYEVSRKWMKDDYKQLDRTETVHKFINLESASLKTYELYLSRTMPNHGL